MNKYLINFKAQALKSSNRLLSESELPLPFQITVLSTVAVGK